MFDTVKIVYYSHIKQTCH